jgi:hypothetical protein
MRDDIIEPLDDPLIAKDGRKLLRPAMPGAGRREGSLNKFTREMKTALLDAAILSPYAKDPNDENAPNSLTNYCLAMCKQFPELYFQALTRLVPKQINTSLRQDTNTNVNVTYTTVAEVKQALLEEGMTPTQIRQLEAMMPDTGKPIDEEARDDAPHDERGSD